MIARLRRIKGIEKFNKRRSSSYSFNHFNNNNTNGDTYDDEIIGKRSDTIMTLCSSC